MFTSKNNSIYDEAGKVFCTLPTSTLASRQAVIAANKARIMALPELETDYATLLRETTSEITNLVEQTAALKAEIARLTAPVVITPPPVVVEPPPVTTPPIIAGQVTSLNEATSQLRAGKSVKLKPGVYVGAMDLRDVNGPVTLDATGVDLTGYVHMQNTKGVTLAGLNLKATIAGIVGMSGCGGITLDGVSVTGQHKGVGTGNYTNVIGFDFPYNVGALSILRCKATDVLSGLVATSIGDFRLEDTEIFGFGDDGYKVNLTSVDGIKNILRNTFGIPIETGSGYHSDMGQLTSIGATSDVPQFNLRIEDNVGFENHDLSEAQVQGLANNFSDGSPAGRLWVNPSVKRNLVMTSNSESIVLSNVDGGVFEDNTVVNARADAPNVPWLSIGRIRKAGVIIDRRNLHSIPHDQYTTLLSWNGIEQPKTRADVIRMLTRR